MRARCRSTFDGTPPRSTSRRTLRAPWRRRDTYDRRSRRLSALVAVARQRRPEPPCASPARARIVEVGRARPRAQPRRHRPGGRSRRRAARTGGPAGGRQLETRASAGQVARRALQAGSRGARRRSRPPGDRRARRRRDHRLRGARHGPDAARHGVCGGRTRRHDRGRQSANRRRVCKRRWSAPGKVSVSAPRPDASHRTSRPSHDHARQSTRHVRPPPRPPPWPACLCSPLSASVSAAARPPTGSPGSASRRSCRRSRIRPRSRATSPCACRCPTLSPSPSRRTRCGGRDRAPSSRTSAPSRSATSSPCGSRSPIRRRSTTRPAARARREEGLGAQNLFGLEAEGIKFLPDGTQGSTRSSTPIEFVQDRAPARSGAPSSSSRSSAGRPGSGGPDGARLQAEVSDPGALAGAGPGRLLSLLRGRQVAVALPGPPGRRRNRDSGGMASLGCAWIISDSNVVPDRGQPTTKIGRSLLTVRRAYRGADALLPAAQPGRRPARAHDAALVTLLRARPDLLSPVPSDLASLAARAATRPSVSRALDQLDRFGLQVVEVLCALPDHSTEADVAGCSGPTRRRSSTCCTSGPWSTATTRAGASCRAPSPRSSGTPPAWARRPSRPCTPTDRPGCRRSPPTWGCRRPATPWPRRGRSPRCSATTAGWPRCSRRRPRGPPTRWPRWSGDRRPGTWSGPAATSTRQRRQPGRVAARPRAAGRHRHREGGAAPRGRAAPARRPGAPGARAGAARARRLAGRPRPRRPGGRGGRRRPCGWSRSCSSSGRRTRRRSCAPAESASASAPGRPPSWTWTRAGWRCSSRPRTPPGCWPPGTTAGRRPSCGCPRRRTTAGWTPRSPSAGWCSRRPGSPPPGCPAWSAAATSGPHAVPARPRPGPHRRARRPGGRARRPRRAPDRRGHHGGVAVGPAALAGAAPGRPAAGRPGTWTVAEARALGLATGGALAGHGRLLAAGDGPAAVTALEAALPPTLDHVLLQADLTAVAPGPLEPALARSLRLVADIESTGGATVYRFTEATVRRAFDAGWTAGDVTGLLARHSRTPVPQPLTYLVDDVGRRHGRVRVGAASSFVRCDDESILGVLLSDRRAASLGLRRDRADRARVLGAGRRRARTAARHGAGAGRRGRRTARSSSAAPSRGAPRRAGHRPGS